MKKTIVTKAEEGDIVRIQGKDIVIKEILSQYKDQEYFAVEFLDNNDNYRYKLVAKTHRLAYGMKATFL